MLLLAWADIVKEKFTSKSKSKSHTPVFSPRRKEKKRKANIMPSEMYELYWKSLDRQLLALQSLLWAHECKIWTLSWSFMDMVYIFLTMTFGCSDRYRLIGFNSKGQVTPRDNETTDISSLIAWSIKTREKQICSMSWMFSILNIFFILLFIWLLPVYPLKIHCFLWAPRSHLVCLVAVGRGLDLTYISRM